ncbi:MAG: DUF302 domain-containing protein [Paracoccus sp. (in: a-proteobacteria)]|uniref:DUF302 domain-containing protein n=1 Tax=Paracoccus sp. TaxID=267 RepID=UPI0026DEDDF2|nr:DUF302 domain-containing protein [Paracoccus sp. (in: a-proteobacteria)]MDO5614352.1 DUF302 domain-containing protein [Paracoccus sp. (in: a-proteobacteria)]
MKRILAAAVLSLSAALPVMASDDDILQRQSDADVATTVGRLTAAIENAGATIFATVDHGQGARDVGADIGESQLVVFGNPRAGTPVMEKDRLAGLILPLSILVYQDASGQVWVAHESIADRLGDLDGLSDDDAAITPLAEALDRLSAVAAGQ